MPIPALRSTSTRWPCSTNSRTEEGVMPTRNSLFLISFGTPTNMTFSLKDFRTTSGLRQQISPLPCADLVQIALVFQFLDRGKAGHEIRAEQAAAGIAFHHLLVRGEKTACQIVRMIVAIAGNRFGGRQTFFH